MRNKLHTMIAVCSLAVLAISPAALACDKEKKVAAQSGTQQVVVVQVADGASTCSKSRQTVRTVTVADASACATQRTMKTLAKAIYAKGSCGNDCANRAAVVTAYRIMADANPDYACKATLASLNTGKTCGSAKTTAVLATTGGAKQCCADKAKTTKVAAGQSTCSKSKARATKVANAANGDPAACAAAKAKTTKVAAGQSTCSKSKARATKVANTTNGDAAACAAAKAKATKVAAGQSTCSKSKTRATTVANTTKGDKAACAAAKAKATKVAAGKSACSSAAKASYIAFGCEKTDRVARAAAVAYLKIMRELQLYSGAKGCSLDTASKLLASILNDLETERTATVAVTSTTETVVTVIETSPVVVVSFGAVSDVQKKTCGASKN